MPIIENDPWRKQYFEGVACPENVLVPTDDPLAHRLFPRHRWIYDRLRVAQSQGLECGVHDQPPPRYPVFCKPIVNLSGMGIGIHVLRNADEFREHCVPGHFWMPLFEGDHVSTDIALQHGEPQWHRHSHGIPGEAGTFDYWVIEADAPRAALTRTCLDWARRNLRGYTGLANIESIGGHIIEAHLRFSDQWPDLYGHGWLQAVVGLYAQGTWAFDAAQPREGFSVSLFGPHGSRFRHPPASLVQDIVNRTAISSVQITFHEDRRNDEHAMPPGGFRLAIVNGTDLAAGMKARDDLRQAYFNPSAFLTPSP